MKTPRRAVVLCAGYGTRLHPLTATVPKPLVPFWGVPNLTHILRSLQSWGVRHVLLNLHHVPEPILHYALSNPVPGLQINISYEPDILGTGGALRKADWFIHENEEPFWIVNADILMVLNPRPMIRLLRNPRTLAALWVDDRSGPRTVECPNGVISTFRSQRAGRDKTFTFCGVQLVRPELLGCLPETPFSTLVDAYERAQKQKWQIRAHVDPESLWCDLGTPEGLLRGHAMIWKRPAALRIPPEQKRRRVALRHKGVKLKGFVSIGHGCQVSKGAFLENVALCDGARVGRNAVVKNAFIAGDIPAQTEATRFVTPAPPSTTITCSLRALGWPLASTHCEHLAPRGSSRMFTRLRHGAHFAMLVEYDAARVENTRYAGHAQFLRRKGIGVPRLLLDSPQQNFTLFEDLGPNSLQETLQRESPSKRWSLYAGVIDAVAHWHTTLDRHSVAALSLEPGFDDTLYHWEQDLFCEHFLADRLAIRPSRIRGIRDELARMRGELLCQPRCLVHRDLQSTNVYATLNGVVFIDFQGMRLGSPFYDLGSLLCDPYVAMPRLQQMKWVDAYAKQCGHDPEQAIPAFWTASAQRLLQAIGAYARNARKPATRYFERHIPAALRMLERTLVPLDNFPRLTDLIADLRPAQK